jgi:hypothetical protein
MAAQPEHMKVSEAYSKAASLKAVPQLAAQLRVTALERRSPPRCAQARNCGNIRKIYNRSYILQSGDVLQAFSNSLIIRLKCILRRHPIVQPCFNEADHSVDDALVNPAK